MFPVLLLLVVCSQVGVSVQLHSWGPFFGQMSLLCLWGRLFRSQTGNKVFRGWKFWFRFRIRFRAELRIRFSLLKEFGNALCLCEVLTSLENQTVCVCVLTHCCYLYRTFLELQGEVFLVSWWLKVLFYQHTVDRREKKIFWIYFQLLTDADCVLFPLKSNIFTVWMTVCFPRILQFPPTV